MLDQKLLSQFFLSIHQPTLVVSAYNYFIFPREVLENPALNIINFHNSLLPRHRGRNAPTWSIYEMDAVTGITWHQVRPTVDTGDIITQKQIAITNGVTALELTLKTLEVAASAFEEILPSLLNDSYARVSVEKVEKGSFHRSTDVPNGGVFDLGWNLKQAYAFLRALDYGKFKIFAAPKVRLLGADLSIVGYQIQKNDSGGMAEPSITYRKKQLSMRDQETELLITCE
jgi:methionyl-tRNA formyltransferase